MSSKEFFEKRYERLGWKYKNVIPRQAIRINVANSEPKKTVERLESRGVKLEAIPFLENGFWVCRSEFSVGATSEYLLGLYSIQEAAAQIPVSLFTEVKHQLMLDACAAPGGKTVQMADRMRNTGALVALDVRRRRLNALANHLERCQVKNTIVYEMDARKASELGLKFGGILLDVPCSGNFAADRDWFKRRTIDDVKRNAKLQREMLAEAVRVLKDDGELVYSTCSLEPEENELNIDWALRMLGLEVEQICCYGGKGVVDVFGKELDSSIENCRRMWPGETQGFFVCKLRKRVARR
jgi:NOL1/NOP2/sun family putative RNA methylase